MQDLIRQMGMCWCIIKKEKKVSKVSSIDDMVYSGTRTPKYTASLKISSLIVILIFHLCLYIMAGMCYVML